MTRDLHLIPVYVAKAITDYPAVKWAGAGIALAAEYFFGTPVITGLAIATFALMFLDTITGFVATAVTGQAITSGKLTRFGVKVIAYGSAVIVAAVVTRHLPGLVGAHEPVVTTILSVLLLAEGISILENISKMGYKRFAFMKRFLEGRLKAVEQALIEPKQENEQP